MEKKVICRWLVFFVAILIILTLTPVKLLLDLPLILSMMLLLTLIIVMIWLTAESFWAPTEQPSKFSFYTNYPGWERVLTPSSELMIAPESSSLTNTSTWSYPFGFTPSLWERTLATTSTPMSSPERISLSSSNTSGPTFGFTTALMTSPAVEEEPELNSLITTRRLETLV
jgi:hypothetical protein